MTRGKQAHARVARILDSSRKLSAGLRKPALLALLTAPLIYVLVGARPVVAQIPQVGLRLAAATTPAAEASDWEASPAVPQSPSAPPATTDAEPAPRAAPAPKPPETHAPEGGEWRPWESGEDLAITDGVGRFFGSGKFEDSDTEQITALRRATSGDIIWFRRNGRVYVIHDPATFKRAQELYSRDTLLERKQDDTEFKAESKAFFKWADEVQKQARVEVPDLRAQLAKLQTELDAVHKHGATLNELDKLQGELANLQGRLSKLQAEAAGKLRRIVAEHRPPGAPQVEKADQLRAMVEEEQQARLEKMKSRTMKDLLEDAVANGLAQPE